MIKRMYRLLRVEFLFISEMNRKFSYVQKNSVLIVDCLENTRRRVSFVRIRNTRDVGVN